MGESVNEDFFFYFEVPLTLFFFGVVLRDVL